MSAISVTRAKGSRGAGVDKSFLSAYTSACCKSWDAHPQAGSGGLRRRCRSGNYPPGFGSPKSTRRLETGKNVTGTWEMYDMAIEVDVKELELNKRIPVRVGQLWFDDDGRVGLHSFRERRHLRHD